MAVKVKLEKDGFIKDGFVGYSYTSVFLDFWVPAFRLDFNGFVIFFGIFMFGHFLSEFFQIYSILNFHSIKDILLFRFLNIGIYVFYLLIGLFIAAWYNKYYTKKMLEEGWRPLENDEYSNAILKGYCYLDYTDSEIKDEDKMQRYKSFIEKARGDERSKCLGFLTLIVVAIILFYFFIY